MADILNAFHARPAIVSSLAALALHAALAAVLPRARTVRAFDLLPRPVEMEFSDPPTEAPRPPARAAPAPIAAAGGGAGAAARAPAIVARKEQVESAPHDATSVAGDVDLPLPGPSSPSSGDGGPGASSAPGSAPPGPPGPPPSAPPPPPSPPVDRSRAPALARGGQWSCPWPVEADQIDDAVVVVTVVVDAAGRASKVEVLADPGYGFGREARRCALREVYVPGLDRDGRPTPSATKSIRVRFSR